MQFELTGQQQLLKKAVREFAEQEVAPRVEEMESTGKTPMDLVEKMAGQGFLGVTAPKEYGGTEMGHLARIIILEEIARVSAPLSMVLQCLHFGAASVIEFGTDAQKEKYAAGLVQGKYLAAAAVTEPSGGSDPSGIVTEATDQGEYYLMNGRKCFITNSHICNMAVVVAKTAEEPKKEFSAFIVDDSMEGFRPGREENKIGFKGSSTGELIFDNVKVPKDALLGTKGKGLAIALKGITEYGRTGIAAIALGLMQASLDATLQFSNERVLYGKPISNLQAITFRIAEMYASLEASRLLAYKAAWLLDQGRRADMEVAAAKFYTSEAALRCTRKAMDSMGGYGCMKEYQVERYLRDAQLLIPADGTNDIQRVVVGKTLAAASKKK